MSLKKVPFCFHSIARTPAIPHSLVVVRSPAIERVKAWAQNIKRDVVALWLAARDPRVPWYAKAIAAAVAGYALSPIDLIPDFLPVVGYLDDLLIVPLGILLAVKFIPEPVMIDLRTKAVEHGNPTSRVGLVFIVLMWLVAASMTIWLFWSGETIHQKPATA